MSRWRVRLSRVSYEAATTVVHALTREGAVDAALSRDEDGLLEWDLSDGDGVEVEEVTMLIPPQERVEEGL